MKNTCVCAPSGLSTAVFCDTCKRVRFVVVVVIVKRDVVWAVKMLLIGRVLTDFHDY